MTLKKEEMTVGAEDTTKAKEPEIVQGVDVKTGKRESETVKSHHKDVEINPGPSQPTIEKSAEDEGVETGPEKAKRLDTAHPPRDGESTPTWASTTDGHAAFAMTNVDGEKLLVTPKQWDKYGQTLMKNGWLKPEFAKDNGGNETIPADIDWGKDKP